MKRLIVVLAASAALFLASVGTATAATPVSWRTFLNHETIVNDHVMTHLDGISVSIDLDDWRGVATDAQGAVSASKADVKWLAARTPQPCFRAAFNAYRVEMKSMQKTYGYLARWAAAFPYGTDADFKGFMVEGKRLATYIERTTAAVEAADC